MERLKGGVNSMGNGSRIYGKQEVLTPMPPPPPPPPPTIMPSGPYIFRHKCCSVQEIPANSSVQTTKVFALPLLDLSKLTLT